MRIIYNQQQTICQGLFSTDCRKDVELCTADPAFTFDTFSSPTSQNVVVVPIPDGYRVSESHRFPGATVRVASKDDDRFPDMMIVLKNETHARMEIWDNVLCEIGVAGCNEASVSKSRRTFQRSPEAMQMELTQLANIHYGTFVDFDEDVSVVGQQELTTGLERYLGGRGSDQ